jgi:HEPN domain-containing protein
MKQTAVEWLYQRILAKDIKAVFEQAKEMEKQHIVDAFVECWKENMPEGYECKQSADEYYKKTFKQD